MFFFIVMVEILYSEVSILGSSGVYIEYIVIRFDILVGVVIKYGVEVMFVF